MRIPYKFRLLRRLDDWSWRRFRVPFKFRWFWQRATRGWSDADTWNLDSYVADILIGGLTRLRERKVGFPAVAFNENGTELYRLEFDDSNTDEQYAAAEVGFDAVMLSIAEGMQAHIDLTDGCPEDWRELEKRRDRAALLFARNFGAFWD